ncbi:PAS domain-containing protein [Histidinibacterium aquaticum]|uniref:PAS domain-containing protein n=1 Tax=Histidinibacterium aquaticum TaxID=2613962 RepID=UPI001CC34134|nr:PAS domain-containing protein [Histidinibacterium aquaticum]
MADIRNLKSEIATTANVGGALDRTSLGIVLTNPELDDNQIVYVNSAFEQMTGYSAASAVGRNCRFLQGEDTDPAAVARLREAIRDKEETRVDLLNYRADGEPFWNRVMVTPLQLGENETPYFLGVQVRITEPGGDEEREDGDENSIDTMLHEIQHRVKNHLSMIVGMIRMQARGHSAEEDFTTLSRRVETLQLLYEEMAFRGVSQRRNDESIDLGAYLTRVASAISHLDGRSGVRVNVNAEAKEVRFETATRIGLLVSEILTNSLQHAFDGRDAGLVEVSIRDLSSNVLRVQISDDGIGLPQGLDWPNDGNLGGRIVRQLADGLESEVIVTKATSGTIITVDVPADQRD